MLSRVKGTFNKGSQEWSCLWVKKPKPMWHASELMSLVMTRENIGSVEDLLPPNPNTISSNIARVPRPQTEVLKAKHISRFSTQ